ncbi:MAG: hypothetical protein HXX16_14505 [Bacteroidales bacterium]|nr:hypothetical protein [Bacteroidales bacterium]
MKVLNTIIVTAMLFSSCKNTAHNMENTTFKAEKVTRTATITLNGNIKAVFPLFGAFEERKWAEGWNPTLIYPSTEIIEEGTTFKTDGHGDESEYLWRVSKYEPENYLIQYLVSTQNRYWTITVKCKPVTDIQVMAEITYTFIGLNELGNKLNQHAIQRMYQHNLLDWAEEINYYITNGKLKAGK